MDKTAEAFRPVLIMNTGCAYTLRRGILLGCAVMADGITLAHHGGEINWSEVDSFDLKPEVQKEIDVAFATLLSFEDEAALIDEYDRWCRDENVPCISADEQDLASLTHPQRRYLNGFILRWENTKQRDAMGDPGVFSHNAWLKGNLSTI